MVDKTVQGKERPLLERLNNILKNQGLRDDDFVVSLYSDGRAFINYLPEQVGSNGRRIVNMVVLKGDFFYVETPDQERFEEFMAKLIKPGEKVGMLKVSEEGVEHITIKKGKQ